MKQQSPDFTRRNERPFQMYDQIKYAGGYLNLFLPKGETFLYMGEWPEGTQSKEPHHGVSILDTENREYRLADHHLQMFYKAGQESDVKCRSCYHRHGYDIFLQVGDSKYICPKCKTEEELL